MVMSESIPKTQTVALIRAQGSPIEFVSDYPVPKPTASEVLVKILYTGVCQSDLHTKNGTATGPDGKPITAIKLPHIGGHEGVGKVISHPCADQSIKDGTLVGVRFLSRVCHQCEYCATDREQHCAKSKNHLHHEDGSFQEYCVLDTSYLTVLPDDVDPIVVGPTLCAGVTAYKAVKNAGLKEGEWLVVVGAGGGLGHFAGKYMNVGTGRL
jgi:alcohol dehydrogenase, propanol-preferring